MTRVTNGGAYNPQIARPVAGSTINEPGEYRGMVGATVIISTGHPNPGAPPSAPSAPSSLTATAIDDQRIDLAWVNNTAGTTVEIERSPNGSTGWSLVYTTAINATTWSNTGLSYSTAYYYRVRANNGSYSGYSGTANATTLAQTIYGDIVSGNDTTGNGTTGNPYQTLTKCLTIAADGATIRLKPGLYTATAQYVIDQDNLTIISNTTTAEISVHVTYPTSGWTLDSGTMYTRSCTEPSVRNAWYNGTPLAVVHTSALCSSTANSIYCDIVADILYVNVGGAPAYTLRARFDDTPAISITGTGVTLQNVDIAYTNKAIAVTGSDCTLDGCNLTYQQGNQAKTSGGALLVPVGNRWAIYVNADDFVAVNCTHTVTSSGAIRFESGSGSEISDCTFYNDAGSSGTNYTIEYRAGTHTIDDCLLRGGYQAAIHSIESAVVTCTGCTVYDFGRIGYYANDGDVGGGTLTCKRCLAYLTYNTNTTESWGFVADTNTAHTINGNMTLYHCVAANLDRNTGAAAGLSMAGFGSNTYGVYVVRNCISKSNRYGYVRDGTPSTWTETNNCANSNTSNFYGFTKHASSITSAPSFVNEGTDDYQLNTGSACIDAGVYIAGVNDGYAGSAPDMGYWEYR